MKKNVLDVTYHVNQYQGIINELKSEIERWAEGPASIQKSKIAAPEGHVQVDILRQWVLAIHRF